MNSPMIERAGYLDKKEGYSELKVMHSAAGYYVGTTFTEDGIAEPGSRDSEYFDSFAEAERYLATVSQAVNPQEYLRDAP